MRDELFRPSSLARYHACPGALALESTLPPQETENEDAAEGRMLHALMADPKASRSHLNDEQLAALDNAAQADAEFVNLIKGKHKL